MVSLLRGIAGFIIAAFLIGFALFNRQHVELIYSPVHEALNLPLYFIVLTMFGLGFLIGGAAVWLNMAGTRKVKRQQKKQIKALEKEITLMKTDVPDNPPPASEFFPSLPSR